MYDAAGCAAEEEARHERLVLHPVRRRTACCHLPAHTRLPRNACLFCARTLQNARNVVEALGNSIGCEPLTAGSAAVVRLAPLGRGMGKFGAGGSAWMKQSRWDGSTAARRGDRNIDAAWLIWSESREARQSHPSLSTPPVRLTPTTGRRVAIPPLARRKAVDPLQ
jgi:hypothetical protein